jgi:hypothetical protein
MGLIITFPHLDFFISYIVTLVSLVNLVLSLPLRRSLSTRMCSVTPSCYLVSHGLSRHNALRRSRSTKATPRVQVGQMSSRNVTSVETLNQAIKSLRSNYSTYLQVCTERLVV